MVNYVTSTAALLAIHCLSAATINAEERQNVSTTRVVIDDLEQRQLRTLYGSAESSHFVKDVEVKCNDIMVAGVCVEECVTVETIKSGSSIIQKTSKVSQNDCKVSVVETEKWEGDGYNKVEVKNDSWKCTETVSHI